MNNGLHTERGYLGVFSTSSYLTIGDMYGKKSTPDPRLLGKQFSQAVPKQGIAGARPNNSMFDREHKWLYGGEKYVDKTMYIKTQPPEGRKKGFGSSDAHKRDQFSLDIEVRARRRAPAARFRCALPPLGRPRRVPESVLTVALPSPPPCPADGEVPPDHPYRDGIRGKVHGACRGEPDGGGKGEDGGDRGARHGAAVDARP